MELSNPYIVDTPHAKTTDEVMAATQSSPHGLNRSEAETRLLTVGPNILPQGKPLSIIMVFLRQFGSPLIYVLIAAAALSLLIREWSDAGFIFAVLMINAIIGTVQEYSAQRAASALQKMVTTRTRVFRDGESFEISSEELVPGDIVSLESGDRVPADMYLMTSRDLEIDESPLTGESIAVHKNVEQPLVLDTALAERSNMAFAGTLVNRGRGTGIIVATALETELGRIAEAVLDKPPPKAPLLVRMEIFTHRIALIVGLAVLVLAIVSFMRGMQVTEIFFLAVALAVSVIPEGLPVALTVTLAVGMRRMAHRHVIIRRLVAVEALGSCTFIATDKTGTLTVNELTVRNIVLPKGEIWAVTGEGMEPEGLIRTSRGELTTAEQKLLKRVALAAILPNEGVLSRQDDHWIHHGDAVDVALLVMAHKADRIRAEAENLFPELDSIPFESEHLFSASLNLENGIKHAFVKGALERLIPMCKNMMTLEGDVPVDKDAIEEQANVLARQGYRVLALASGEIMLAENEVFSEEHLNGLTLIGIVGMIDPLRQEARGAVSACQGAGVEVVMLTGDHPATALAIARELGLANKPEEVVGRTQLQSATEVKNISRLIEQTRVFARVEPQQKLDIVHALQQGGHFVAVSGDGANDAPALRAAHVGIAMGKSGTDVAKETADIIITDDNFSSIVAGIEEGRIAYANVRKVIFLLVSTGAAELVLFTLALLTGQPLPLLAVQLLWLNLVTNGIQDIALAFEPAEGDELKRPPRSPGEPVFNKLMIQRVVISAITMGIVAFLLFQWLLNAGYSIDEARNGTLLLMVLFENIHVFNCRSEHRSVFRQNLFSNPILLVGTMLAQMVHIGAMYLPWLSDVLGIQPVSPFHWLQLLVLALAVLLAMEIHKAVYLCFLARKS